MLPPRFYCVQTNVGFHAGGDLSFLVKSKVAWSADGMTPGASNGSLARFLKRLHTISISPMRLRSDLRRHITSAAATQS